MIEEVLFDDTDGRDLLIDKKHNVNLECYRECLSTVTHTARDGMPMEVQFNSNFGTYFVLVSRSRNKNYEI